MSMTSMEFAIKLAHLLQPHPTNSNFINPKKWVSLKLEMNLKPTRKASPLLITHLGYSDMLLKTRNTS